MNELELWHGDCLEKMWNIADASVDMIFTDLPYGTTKCKWDSVIPLEPLWKHYRRIIKENGAIVLFAQTPFDKILGASNLEMLRYEWIWEKTQATGHLNAKKMPMKAHENLLVFYKKLPTYHPQMTEGHEPVHSYTKRISVQNNTELYGFMGREISGGGETVRYPRSVLRFASDKQTSHLHPTQKPLALCEYMIRTYTDAYLVLTGYAGIGGTTADAIIKWFWNHADEYQHLCQELTIEETNINAEQNLEGMVFVITGKLEKYANRDTLKREIESRGGKVSGSVSGNTNYLINNDIASTSGKNKKAKELSIPIITEQDFVDNFL